MLQLIRDRVHGIFSWAIIGFIILGLSSFILSEYLGSSVITYVAKVNDVEITDREFQYAYNQFITGVRQQKGAEAVSLFSESQMRPQLIDSLIRDELLRQYLNDAGFRISYKRIAAEIKRQAPELVGEDGKISQSMYSEVLKQQGTTEQQVELSIAAELKYQQYKQSIYSTAYVTNKDVDDYITLERQTRDMGYVSVPMASVISSITVSDEEIQQYYTDNSSRYMTNAKARLDYIEINRSDLISSIEISNDDLLNSYEINKGSYIVDDVAAGTKKANEIRARIVAGEDFSNLAEEFSSDSFSAKNGGALPPLMQGEYAKEFDDVVFSLNLGEISQPVITTQGIHIIKLDEIIEGDVAKRRVSHILLEIPKTVKPFDEVKNELLTEIRDQRADDLFYEKVNKLDRLSFDDQQSLQTAATELQLEIKTGPFITSKGGPQFWANSDVVKASFSNEVIREKLNSPVIRLSEDHVLVVRISDYQEAQLIPLADVQADIRKQITQTKAVNQTLIIAREIQANLSSGKSIQESIKGLSGVTWKDVGFIGREARFDKSAVTQAIPASIRNMLFTLAKPKSSATYFAAAIENGESVVIVLRSVRSPELVEITEAERLAAAQMLEQEQAGINDATLLTYLRAQAEIIIPQVAVEDDVAQ